MRILLTGGHFSPAYSVLKRLIRQKHTVAIAGRKYVFEGDNVESLEYLVARKNSVPFYVIRTGRIQRKFTRFTIPSLGKIPRGIFDSFKALIQFKPDIVLTFGGYISFPVSLSSFLLRIPIVLHEQTQKAGLAARLIGTLARKICVSYEVSRKYFPSNKVVLTGNPIREEIYRVNKKFEIEKGLPVIYFTGGSSGSNFINSCVEALIGDLIEKYVVIHQTGGSRFFKNYSRLQAIRNNLPQELKGRYVLKKFIYPEEIGFVLNVADLIISRAGINTVMELLALGKMCLLIPLASGQSNEQLENAKLVKEAGIGDYLEQEHFKSRDLLAKIKNMIQNRNKFEKNREKAEKLIIKDADRKILQVLEQIWEEESSKKE